MLDNIIKEEQIMKKILCVCLLLLTLVIALTACGNETTESTIAVGEDGFLVVNGVKTEHKVHTEPTITVVDGYVVVNGVKTEYEVNTADVITIEDGFLVVNGVKTEHEVKNKNHSFSDWKLYNEDVTNCEKKLYYRTCSDCSTIEWKEGKYEDHAFTTVTTPATCQAKGYDTKTCNNCGKTEICNETPISTSNHAFGDWYVKNKATCSTNGLEERICICGKSETKTILAIGTEHVPVIDEAIMPTYTERGKTEGSHCSICGTVLVEQRDIATIWNGTVIQPTKLVEIGGVYYYEINSAEELAYLTTAPTEWQNYNFILNCDIYLNPEMLEFDSEGNLLNNTDNLRNWNGFKCKKFNGNNHTINRIYSITGGGFISYCDEVSDVHVKNSYIYTSKNTSIGGVCNGAYHDITNCSFDGVVIGVGKMGVGTSTGDVDNGVGGIAGYQSIYGSITNCNNYGFVKGTYGVGGIVGTASTIRNCNNYGNVSGTEKVGGICGFNDFWSGVIDSTNYGTVSGISDVGGIVGKSTGNSNAGSSSCSNYGTVMGKNYVGGIIGNLANGRISNCNNYAMVNGETYVGGITGYCNHGRVYDCKTSAIVSGTENVGGVVGFINLFSDDASVSNCFYLKDASNNSTLIGISNLDDAIGRCESKESSFFKNN